MSKLIIIIILCFVTISGCGFFQHKPPILIQRDSVSWISYTKRLSNTKNNEKWLEASSIIQERWRYEFYYSPKMHFVIVYDGKTHSTSYELSLKIKDELNPLEHLTNIYRSLDGLHPLKKINIDGNKCYKYEFRTDSFISVYYDFENQFINRIVRESDYGSDHTDFILLNSNIGNNELFNKNNLDLILINDEFINHLKDF